MGLRGLVDDGVITRLVRLPRAEDADGWPGRVFTGNRIGTLNGKTAHWRPALWVKRRQTA